MAKRPELEYRNPVDRFVQLPEPTRKWLEELREGDIDDINEAIKFQHNLKLAGRLSRWLIITIVGSFVAAIQFAEAIQKGLSWLFHRGSQ